MARKTSKISIFTVAKELGISASTVSRVANNRSGVSEETRQKVLELLRKHKFKTNYPAMRNPTIGIVMTSYDVDFYTARLLSGIYHYSQNAKLNATTLVYNQSSKESLLEMLRAQQYSGVILILPTVFFDQIPELAESGLPIMLIDEPSTVNNIGFIDNDSYSGSREATKYLLELDHRNIAYLSYWQQTLNHVQRLNGYRNAMQEAGIDIAPSWLPDCSGLHARSSMHIGEIMLNNLLENAPEITAVMTTNDELAFGVLAAARKRGVRVPEELSVIGFDNYTIDEFTAPSLTTVNHPCEDAGELAAKAIDEFLQSAGQTVLPRIILPTKMILRESTAPPRRD
jgi:DNA-binding LacI/PurR family transcriptional regulator